MCILEIAGYIVWTTRGSAGPALQGSTPFSGHRVTRARQSAPGLYLSTSLGCPDGLKEQLRKGGFRGDVERDGTMGTYILDADGAGGFVGNVGEGAHG